ncbi:hypothetical protein [Streptomyces sp. SP18CS02]|uniref:hypothetical protein n=1 Tax=Streptomyces sp. SP18CS02 TaxID=3002531 RepID=UPI002E762B06|nr:hypothetical protein [Streptomyces sp. SP18CS02]MEE1752697.1 hypothetical protein [Streptomyces sp. SP18CS02]
MESPTIITLWGVPLMPPWSRVRASTSLGPTPSKLPAMKDSTLFRFVSLVALFHRNF